MISKKGQASGGFESNIVLETFLNVLILSFMCSFLVLLTASQIPGMEVPVYEGRSIENHIFENRVIFKCFSKENFIEWYLVDDDVFQSCVNTAGKEGLFQLRVRVIADGKEKVVKTDNWKGDYVLEKIGYDVKIFKEGKLVDGKVVVEERW